MAAPDLPHLLVVPDGVGPDDVAALVVSRFPDAADGGEAGVSCAVEIEPGIVVDGPWRADVPGLPDWAAACYRLVAPEQRGAPVPPELRGRGDLLDAFADGEPFGQEREMLELGLAAARRLGGVVRTSSGAVLVPPPLPDLLVFGETWLHPDALVHVLAPHLPGLHLPVEPAGSLPPDARTGASLLRDDGERRWLHAEADAYDAAALQDPDVTESYGVVATDPDGTIWSVAVEAAVVVPPVLAGRVDAGAILYELRVHASAGPPPHAVARVDAAARALQVAVGGHVVDDDGFLVDLGLEQATRPGTDAPVD